MENNNLITNGLNLILINSYGTFLPFVEFHSENGFRYANFTFPTYCKNKLIPSSKKEVNPEIRSQ